MNKNRVILALFLAIVFISSIYAAYTFGSQREVYLEEIYPLIQSKEFVDLTHEMAPDIPRWSGYPSMIVETPYTYKKDGFYCNKVTLVEHYGTHMGAPAHFVEGGETIDEIPVNELIMPLCVIDVEEKCEKNPDYQLSVEDIKDWESRNRRIPKHSFVIMRSGWSKRWSNVERFENRDKDGVMHTPGWSLDTLKFLFKERNINGVAHETGDTDAGFTKSFDCESYVFHSGNFQIENIANVDDLPESGALVIIGVPKMKSGSGFPCRVYAVLPQ